MEVLGEVPEKRVGHAQGCQVRGACTPGKVLEAGHDKLAVGVMISLGLGMFHERALSCEKNTHARGSRNGGKREVIAGKGYRGTWGGEDGRRD